MKGFVAASVPPAKRRWRGFAVAVLALVCCSVLVPLVFLLGFHNGFPSGYSSDDHSSLETSLRRYGRLDGVRELPEVLLLSLTSAKLYYEMMGLSNFPLDVLFDGFFGQKTV